MITFKNVSYILHDNSENKDIHILEKINLTINEGEFVAILGANGSSKSTLAKMMNGLIKPTSGKVFINNMDTSEEKNLQKIRSTVGIVFQNPDNQIVAATVEDDIAFGPENLNIDANEIEKRIDNVLNLMDLKDKRKVSPYMLSGGQKQKVAIASALAMNTKAIIFDEATSMLDPKSRCEVLNKIIEINKKNGVTIIYISHFTEEILNADKAVVMDNGKLIFVGTVKELFNDESIKNLEPPFYYTVAQKLRENGIKILDKITDENALIFALKKLKK